MKTGIDIEVTNTFKKKIRFNKLILIALFFLLTNFNLADKGMVTMGKIEENDLIEIDLQIEKFLNKYDIPGASVAICKDGKLVFTKGYGVSDKETGEKVTPYHLFRIASLSKSVTAATILKLSEEGKLSLDDKVFGENGILGQDYSTTNPEVNTISVRNLLNHTSGGWKNSNYDPMFQYPSFNQQQLIQRILQVRPLENPPGEKYGYSNFGYSLLGRIIEKITGQTYENYVNNVMLKPLGINNMHIGGDTKEERLPGEVTYYSQEQNSAYGMKIRRMDSHGGWVASSSEILKFLVHIDGLEGKTDILSEEMISVLSTGSSVNPGYACGFQVNSDNNWWHTGCLPGSAALMLRSSEGLSWVILVNSRSMSTNFFPEMDRTMWRIVKNVKEWPDVDLFETPDQQNPGVLSTTAP